MSNKKKKANKQKAAVPPYLKTIIKFGFGRGRSLILSILVVGIFAVAWRGTWLAVRENVVASRQYWVTPDRIKLIVPARRRGRMPWPWKGGDII